MNVFCLQLFFPCRLVNTNVFSSLYSMQYHLGILCETYGEASWNLLEIYCVLFKNFQFNLNRKSHNPQRKKWQFPNQSLSRFAKPVLVLINRWKLLIIDLLSHANIASFTIQVAGMCLTEGISMWPVSADVSTESTRLMFAVTLTIDLWKSTWWDQKSWNGRMHVYSQLCT